MAQLKTDCEGFARRDFLKIGAGGLFGLSLPQLLEMEARASQNDRSPTGRAKSVIMVWLAGGPATIDMWDLRPNAPDGIRGEFGTIPTRLSSMASANLPKSTLRSGSERSLLANGAITLARKLDTFFSSAVLEMSMRSCSIPPGEMSHRLVALSATK